MDRFQSTIRQRVRMVGTGLHSGRSVTLEILPAAAHTGIVFQRTDLQGAPEIAAQVANISATELSTTLGSPAHSVSTVEHLLAAFAGVGIDNARVLLNGPEVPIMDGSAAPFVQKLIAAGKRKVEGLRRLLVVKEAFEVRDGPRFMRVEPDSCLSFHCEIAFPSAAIGRQALDLTFSQAAFLAISGARTFCHVKEVNAMHAAGLALGGSLENAIVVTDNAVMNAEGLRSEDEFVRHKLLDCVGDLSLLGAPLVGRVQLSHNGHALHARFMRELLKHQDTYLTAVDTFALRDKKAAIPDGLRAAALAALYG